MRDAEFNDPRLVAVYDAESLWGVDDDFFVSVVRQASGTRVLDLGCGTGRLALGLARAGAQVTGVDPAAASLAAARAKPGAELVTWVQGTSPVLAVRAFDAAVMTSHVAQMFLDDVDWAAVLRDLHGALVPGGLLTFDSRDPTARGWESWQHRSNTVEVGGRPVTVVTRLVEVAEPLVTFTLGYTFDDGTRLESTTTLRWRTESELRESLRTAGFEVVDVFGGWGREPVGHADGELLVVARA